MTKEEIDVKSGVDVPVNVVEDDEFVPVPEFESQGEENPTYEYLLLMRFYYLVCSRPAVLEALRDEGATSFLEEVADRLGSDAGVGLL